MTGFVEPFRFSNGELDRLERLLGQYRAGDAEGRRLLIAATEYEIGLCLDEAMRDPGQRPESEGEPVSPDSTNVELNPIASAAERLSNLLKISSEESRQRIETSLSAADPLGRSYGERFLPCLATELDRLVDGCRQSGEAEKSSPAPLPEYAQTFFRQMHLIYTECLELQPGDTADDPFYHYLKAITEIGGIGPFPFETVLKEPLKP